MLASTEVLPLTTGLQIVLWIEAIVYLGLGLFELFDDFLVRPKPWMFTEGRANSWIVLQHKVGHKMHAGICFLLGFIAANGLLEGAVTRFELELIFVSFAVLMPTILALLPPGRIGLLGLTLKPEFWLQFVMFALASDLVRPAVLGLCLLLNLWGIIVYLLHTRRTLFVPYRYETFRQDCAAAEGEALAMRMDRLAGRSRSVDDGK